MADSNIKKVRIKHSEFPPINRNTEGYSVRYRLISNDRNRVSHWSPTKLMVPDYTYIDGNKSSSSAGQVATFTWDPVTVLKSKETKIDISNKSLTSNLATLTTTGAHYMNVGDWVTIQNVDSTFNGTYKINSIPSATTFTYYKNNANISSAAVSPYGTRITNSKVDVDPEYDIWIRWDRNDGGDWLYKERVKTTSVSYPHASFYTINNVVQPIAPNRVSVEIYILGEPIRRTNNPVGVDFLKVYEILNQTI